MAIPCIQCIANFHRCIYVCLAIPANHQNFISNNIELAMYECLYKTWALDWTGPWTGLWTHTSS